MCGRRTRKEKSSTEPQRGSFLQLALLLRLLRQWVPWTDEKMEKRTNFDTEVAQREIYIDVGIKGKQKMSVGRCTSLHLKTASDIQGTQGGVHLHDSPKVRSFYGEACSPPSPHTRENKKESI